MSISSALATPSSTMRAASFIASAWMRGTMKPGVAAQTTGTFPMASSSALTSSMMAGSVALPGEISTSGIR
ncbi:thiamine pyrophosphate-dependent acetolactate synthase large subunit-like protein [Bradyrhizobium sp. i1.3.6]